ncbi:RagB/SusD family nutrient uptake outer membrane protein [Xanthocytophaga agilis]|uniref:RagB/SusD family nutrient uptake outer membrane protein n=1 Tax=Xanthocytophaga agilis TaxID=3048010 RepID=A0AAE3RA54_9BACT|nr:RagB/SusD family nutrient uptake outer membrane protein [Xanthocytophaga agilis]MDJ1504199.1 RagB/SusD family nutrient uptake outer membrane protein [Xanthocytophaga agilis]
MKKYVFSACILLFALGSCQLNETVYSSIAENNFYKTASDAEAGLTAVYGALGDLYSGPSPLMIADFSADQVYPRPVVGRNTYTLYSYDPNYTTAKSFGRAFESPLDVWQNCYRGIERANWVIDRVPSIAMETTRRDQIVAEAYFLRAFFHWMLAKNFGSVPIKTNPTLSEADAYTPKSELADVYTQIYNDLEKAEAALPSYSAAIPTGRPSLEVAAALHAKAALYDQKWPVALQKAQEVINSGKYKLLPDVQQVYGAANEQVGRAENMWAFESESVSGGRSSQIMSLYGPRNSDGPEYGKSSFGSIFAYQAFFDSFEANDKRRQLLDTNYINVQGKVVHQKDITPVTTQGVLVKKYQDPNSNGGSAAANIPILRMADVYLIAAEAEAHLNGATTTAYQYINIVRARAGLDDLAEGLSQDAFIDAVLQERSWEFFAEGDRWYDLTRTNKFLTVIPAAVNSVFPVRTLLAKHKYFPIPQDEINANPRIEQNPDWK